MWLFRLESFKQLLVNMRNSKKYPWSYGVGSVAKGVNAKCFVRPTKIDVNDVLHVCMLMCYCLKQNLRNTRTSSSLSLYCVRAWAFRREVKRRETNALWYFEWKRWRKSYFMSYCESFHLNSACWDVMFMLCNRIRTFMKKLECDSFCLCSDCIFNSISYNSNHFIF